MLKSTKDNNFYSTYNLVNENGGLEYRVFKCEDDNRWHLIECVEGEEINNFATKKEALVEANIIHES